MIVNIVFGKNEKKKKENDIHEECEEKETGKMLNYDKFMSLKKIKEEPSILKFQWNELAKEKENWRKEKKLEIYRLDEEIKYKRDICSGDTAQCRTLVDWNGKTGEQKEK